MTKEKPYSSDRNLLHISFEGGILEDTWKEPPEDMFVMSVSPENAPDRVVDVDIEFKDGIEIGRVPTLKQALAEIYSREELRKRLSENIYRDIIGNKNDR